MDKEKNVPLTQEQQELIQFFSDRSQVIKREQEETAQAFLAKIASREIGEPQGYQKVKKIGG